MALTTTLKKIAAVSTVVMAAWASSAQAADTMHQFNFNEAVQRAVADGTLDGSVKFYLAGTQSGGKIIQKDLISNKKTNGFAKPAATACDHVLRSALIQFQNTAKAQDANAVTNVTSFFKSNETRSSTTYDCAKGTAMAGVTLKGDLVKF